MDICNDNQGNYIFIYDYLDHNWLMNEHVTYYVLVTKRLDQRHQGHKHPLVTNVLFVHEVVTHFN